MSEVGKPSFYDAVLSTQFDECSIAASDTCRRANALISEGNFEQRDLFIVDNLVDGGCTTSCSVSHLTFIDIPTTLTEQPMVELVLERSAEGLDAEGRQTRPTLLAIINKDIALPIASFETRRHGQCSYVQLGQEIVEDSLVVTSRDTRAKHVEAIRELLTARPAYENKDVLDISEETADLLRDFITRELEQYCNEAQSLLGPSLAKYVRARLEKSGQRDVSEYLILGGNEQSHEVRKLFGFGIVEHIDADGRWATICVGSEQPSMSEARTRRLRNKRQLAQDREVGLYAVTRDDVALELVSFRGDQVLVMPFGDELPRAATPEEMKVLRTLLVTNYQDYKKLCDEMIGREQTRANWNIAASKNVGKLREELQACPKTQWNKSRYGTEDNPEYKKLYNQLIIASRSQILRRAFGMFGIEQKFRKTLGEYDDRLEKVFSLMGNLVLSAAGMPRKGVMTNQRVGKTITNIEVFANVRRPNEAMYAVEISGRPLSQPDFEPVTIFDKLLLRTQPNRLEEDELEDILKGLQAASAE